MSSVLVISGIVVNILSVVGIVICIKYITDVDKYKFMVFLSFLHFLFTAIGTRLFLCVNMFTYSAAPLSGVLPVAIVRMPSITIYNSNFLHLGKFVVSSLHESQLSAQFCRILSGILILFIIIICKKAISSYLHSYRN